MATTVWRGHLVFGLVSFPVRLFRAARAEKVGLRRLYRPSAPEPEHEPEPQAKPRFAPGKPQTQSPPAAARGSAEQTVPSDTARFRSAAPEPPPAPVHQTHNTITAEDGVNHPIAREELVKGYEFEKGQYVVLDKEELESITPQTSKEMQIVEFVRMAEIDPIFLETSYYLSPDGPGERPYALLQEALKETGYVGLAQLAMHRREHVVIIRPGPSGMIAHTMFYPDEVRGTQEFRTDPSTLVPRELDMAKRLIETMVVPFEPEKFRDTYRERLEAMIAEKVAGHRISREPVSARKSAAVIDIMQALQESLNLAKKPPKSAAGQASGAKAAGSSRRR